VGRALRAAAIALGCAACVPGTTWRAVGPDHRHTVEVRRAGDRACVRMRGAAAQCHEAVALDELVIGPDGHLAYAARDAGEWAVVRDGVRGPAWDGVASLVLSPDGTRLAYAARDGAAWRVVVDDTAGPPFDSLFAGSVTFDPTGRRLGYVVLDGDSARAVVDGAPSAGAAGVARLTFSGDGSHVAWLQRTTEGTALVVDGHVGRAFPRIGGFALSPLSNRQAWTALEADGWHVVQGDLVAGPFESVRSLTYAPGADVLFWITRAAGADRVYRDGVAGPAWDSVTSFTAVGDGRWSYLGYDRDGVAIVVDGVVRVREAWASSLARSDDGARVAWLTRRGDSSVVVDASGPHAFDLFLDGSLLFLSRGRAWAGLAGERRRHRLFVVVEGLAERRPFDWSESTRLLGRDPSGGLLVAWVRAEAELMLATAADRVGTANP